MIEKNALNLLSDKLGIPDIALLEKDLLLHGLLMRLSTKKFPERFEYGEEKKP